MTSLRLLFLVILAALTGCDTLNGVSRGATVHTLPDLPAVKARLERYPEIREVKLWEATEGRPLTLTGLQKAEEVFYLSYTDQANVRGTLMFTRNYKGEVAYSQYLLMINARPPQPWIDATWPVMKKIERDLEESFGLPEISATLKTCVWRVEDPERRTTGPSAEPAAARGRD